MIPSYYVPTHAFAGKARPCGKCEVLWCKYGVIVSLLEPPLFVSITRWSIWLHENDYSTNHFSTQKHFSLFLQMFKSHLRQILVMKQFLVSLIPSNASGINFEKPWIVWSYPSRNEEINFRGSTLYLVKIDHLPQYIMNTHRLMLVHSRTFIEFGTLHIECQKPI